MLLKNKKAVIYRAGGGIGGAVARAFAREGAKVFLAGRAIARSTHSQRKSVPLEESSRRLKSMRSTTKPSLTPWLTRLWPT